MKCKQHQSQILSPPYSAPPPSTRFPFGWCTPSLVRLNCPWLLVLMLPLLLLGLFGFWFGLFAQWGKPLDTAKSSSECDKPSSGGGLGGGEWTRASWGQHYPLWRAGIIKINELTFTCRSIWPQKRNKCTTDLLFWMLICRGECRLRRGGGAAVKDQEHPPYVHIHLITGMSSNTPPHPPSHLLLWSIANLLFMRMIFPFVFPTIFSLFSHSFLFSLSDIKVLRFIHQWASKCARRGKKRGKYLQRPM